MAIINYGELKTAVASWLNRDDLTSRIPEFIAAGEDRISLDTRFRVRAMETSADITISAQTAALPTGFLGARRLYLSGDPVLKLDFRQPLDFWQRYASSQTGKPKLFTIEGENFVFGPTPDSTYTGKLLYWKRFTALSGDTDANWLLTNARMALVYAALVEASPYIGDDTRTMTWAQLYDDMGDRVFDADQYDRYSGGELQMFSDVTAD